MRTSSIYLLTIVLWIGFNSTELISQKSRKVNRNSFVIDIDTGLSFADYDKNQAPWKPTFYPTVSLGLLANARLNARIDVDYGLGGTFYYLTNRSVGCRYVLDFASPYAVAGLGYSFLQTSRQENYIKIQGITQLGYNDTLLEEFDTYEVEVVSTSKYYFSIKTQFGFRRFVERSSKGGNKKTADEYGVLFRFSLQNLGTATFTGDNFQNVISPTGSIAGIYYKVLFDYGGKKIKRKARATKIKEVELPPIIYNPRY